MCQAPLAYLVLDMVLGLDTRELFLVWKGSAQWQGPSALPW